MEVWRRVVFFLSSVKIFPCLQWKIIWIRKRGESQSSEQLGQQTTEAVCEEEFVKSTIHHQDSSLDPGTSSFCSF